MKRRIGVVLSVVLGLSAIVLSGGCSKNQEASAKCNGQPQSNCNKCCTDNGASYTITTKVNGRFTCGCGGTK